ncbi:MAG TPA: hypothetical protein VIG99_02090 [Myxococcaceae bacterium]
MRGHQPLLGEFSRLGYDDARFRESRVAARLNGLVSGFGTKAQLERELPEYGLSDPGVMYLRNVIAEGSGATCG